MSRQKIHTEQAPAAVGPYSQGNIAGNLVFSAGQLGLDPKTGQFVSDNVQDQTRQALENLRAVLEAGGVSLADVAKTTVFLSDMGNFKAMNEIYAQFFTDPYPARSAVAVKDLPLGGLVEIEAIAVKPR
jgi:2-iminobutanoate/2-iminopropanoate deaminase